MPEIILLVCSVVSVCPLLYTEEHSDLRESRSSRSCDTLHSKRHNNMRCKRRGKLSFFLQEDISFTFGQVDPQRGISHPEEFGCPPLVV